MAADFHVILVKQLETGELHRLAGDKVLVSRDFQDRRSEPVHIHHDLHFGMAEMGWPAFVMNFGEMELGQYLRQKPVDTMSAMIGNGMNAPTASSCGRLFDAVAAAIGICRDNAFHEGEAAIRLEALIDAEVMAAVDDDLAYPFGIPNLKELGLPYIEPAAMTSSSTKASSLIAASPS